MTQPESDPNASTGQVRVLLGQCLRDAQRYMVRTARREGLLVSDLKALTRIAETDGISAGALARSLPLDASSVTELADRLERAGYIERTRSLSDRRQVMLCPTPAGTAKAIAAHQALNLRLTDALAPLSHSDLVVVTAFLQRVDAALTRLTGPAASPQSTQAPRRTDGGHPDMLT